MPLSLLHHMVPVNGGNFCLIMPIVKGRCARGVLHHTSNICVFKCGKNNYKTIHIYNQFVNIYDSCDVTFDSND